MALQNPRYPQGAPAFHTANPAATGAYAFPVLTRIPALVRGLDGYNFYPANRAENYPGYEMNQVVITPPRDIPQGYLLRGIRTQQTPQQGAVPFTTLLSGRV